MSETGIPTAMSLSQNETDSAVRLSCVYIFVCLFVRLFLHTENNPVKHSNILFLTNVPEE